MELDKETHDKIIETHTHVIHILEELKEGKSKFKEQDKRLSTLEGEQQLLRGKITIIVLGVGVFVTALSNLVFYFWSRLIGR